MEVATETSGVAAERTVLFGQETTVWTMVWTRPHRSVVPYSGMRAGGGGLCYLRITQVFL